MSSDSRLIIPVHGSGGEVVTSPPLSKGRMFEAHPDPCSLLEREATLPSPEK